MFKFDEEVQEQKPSGKRRSLDYYFFQNKKKKEKKNRMFNQMHRDFYKDFSSEEDFKKNSKNRRFSNRRNLKYKKFSLKNFVDSTTIEELEEI